MTSRLAILLLLALPIGSVAAAAASPAQLISDFRLKHGEGRVAIDATLNAIALDQARAMAAKDSLDHDVLGSFTSRIARANAGRAAENIAYGYDNFDKTLTQWIELERASQESAAAQGDPRWRCQRDECRHASHLLGDGDRGRL